MYLHCMDCGEIFEESEAGKMYDDPSPAGVGLPSGSIEYTVCPKCGSDYIEDAEECPLCGTPFASGEEVCPDCAATITERWKKFLEDLFWDLGTGDNKEGESTIADFIAERLM